MSCGGQRAELARFQGYYGTGMAPGIARVSSTVGGVIGTVVDTFRANPRWIRDSGWAGSAPEPGGVGRFGGYFLAKVRLYGAYGLARMGVKYDEMVKHYYSGVDLVS